MDIKKLKLPIFIPILLIFGSFIYALFLISTNLVFYYDQARDAYEAYGIWHDQNLKILGPSSDIPGIHHGVIWFYFLALIYGLGQGLPENAVRIMMTGLYLMIPVMWYFTRKMSKDQTLTATSMALYALAPLFIAFTMWLSNPTLALFVTPPLFYILWQYLQKQHPIYALLAGFLYGLLIQTNFAFLVMMFSLPIYYVVFKLRFSLRDIAVFTLGWLVGMLPFFISYIKFQTNIVGIILQFLSHSTEKGFSVGNTATILIDQIVRLFTLTYLPLPALIAFFLILFVVIKFRKILFANQNDLTKHALIWLTGLFFLFVFNRGNLSHTFFFAPFMYPLAIFVAIILLKLIKDKRILIGAIIGIALLQVGMIHTWMSKSESPLSIQKGMTTYYERHVIDYVFQSAGGQPFVINTITNPLYVNTTWAYWFTMYGQPTYGYVPYLWGQSQDGYLGSLPMQTDLTTIPQRYLIIEPSTGIDKYWIIKATYDEDLLSDVIDERTFGNFTVQKRLFHPNKQNVATPAALLKNSSAQQ